MTCRCGHDGADDHFCHRCHKAPGTRRWYVPHFRFALAGMQRKASALETVACDSCWSEFAMHLRREDTND